MINSIYSHWRLLSFSSLEEKDLEYLITYSYKITASYLSHKFSSIDLFKNNYTTIDELAIDVTTNIFSKDNTDKIKLTYSLNRFSEFISNEKKIEFYLIKNIKERVDKAISFELLKYNLVDAE
ncbi:MAG: hypothetical protein GY936_20855 [Ignavibacteriae bacterium]|nr:hypothetical protein [Ignavibacteriota bacterium]